MGGQVAQNLVRLVGEQQFRHVHRALLQNLQRRADTAGDGELDQRLQFRRPRDADMDQLFPAIGEHGRDVLTGLGLNSEAIDGLVAKGAVHLPD